MKYLLIFIGFCIVLAGVSAPMLAMGHNGHFSSCANSLLGNVMCHSDKTGLFSFLILFSIILVSFLAFNFSPKSQANLQLAFSKTNSENDASPNYLATRKTDSWLSIKENSPSL